MNISYCPHCGTERAANGVPCATCGRGDVTIECAAGDSFRVTGEAVTLIHSKPENQGFNIIAGTGSRSEAALKDGRLHATVHGPVDIGQPGEPRARGTLIEALQAKGLDVTWRLGKNERGEDCVLVINGQNVTLQITTAPGAPTFWQDVGRDSGSTDVEVSEAARRWVRGCIVTKDVLTDKPSTILAIDAFHFGPLASRDVVVSYLSQFNDPRTEFGWGAVYIVGPTASATTRLGSGNW